MTAPDFSTVLPQLLPAAVPLELRSALSRALGLTELQQVYQAVRGEAAGTGGRLLQALEASYCVAARDVAQVPKTGPVLMVWNHPFGILEGAVLMEVLRGIRGDVRFLGNQILATIPELKDWVIPVDVMGKGARENRNGMRQAIAHLERGGLLVVFPAGEVAHFQWRGMQVEDPHWSGSVARMAAMVERRVGGLQIVPGFIEGRNSWLFQAAGMVHGGFRTALLAREFLNKRGTEVALRIGSAFAASRLKEIGSTAEQTAYLRWRTYLLAARNAFTADTRKPVLSARTASVHEIAAGVDSSVLAKEVAQLTPLVTGGGYQAYLAKADEIPEVMREIGRLREISFRAVGEGTGKALDIDSFDETYWHLFVWQAEKREVVGAYRLGETERLGCAGLYTSTLFRYGDAFLRRMGPALELGRSWVRPEYQRSFGPLLLLWKGIGKFVARNPRCKVLFGPVSISNQYQTLSRELMVGFLEKHAALEEWRGLVGTRNPFRMRRNAGTEGFLRSCSDLDELSQVVTDIEPQREGVPVLLRQYLKLGGRLLGFNVDAEFSAALDGLIVVDLTKTPPKLLERYLGKTEAMDFLNYQRG